MDGIGALLLQNPEIDRFVHSFGPADFTYEDTALSTLTYQTGTDLEYAQTILRGVTIDNVTRIGCPAQTRIYSNGDESASQITPADTGLIFSTGAANQFDDTDTDNDLLDGIVGSYGDSLISDTLWRNTYDAAGIEIEFTANQTGSFTIPLTFLTEEYPSNQGITFSDTAGVYLNENLQPISNTDSGYFDVASITDSNFINNGDDGGVDLYNTNFNAIRTGTCTINVVAGQSYTLRIVVADVGDAQVDSALMIGAGAVAICFAKGTLIETVRGPVAVEHLTPGDLVHTRDNGPQPLRWIGARELTPSDLARNAHLRPVRIRKGSLGNGTPSSDLVVSPQHRVLVRSCIAERMFGTREVLVAAKHLCEMDGIEIATDLPQVEYYHILFDRHEVVLSNGAETESLYTGREALRSLSPHSRAEVFALLPNLGQADSAPPLARTTSNGRKGRKLVARHVKNNRMLVEDAADRRWPHQLGAAA